MKTSESIKEIMSAIKEVQQRAGTIQKTSEGQVGTRKYKYADLKDTWEVVKPLLDSNDLVVIQSPTTGTTQIGQFFVTRIYHIKSDQWIEEMMQMVMTRDDPQSMGSSITYYRRYMVTSMLGLIPDDDNDAKSSRLATAVQKQRIVGAVKELYPDISKPEDIINTIQNIFGKHPSNIREDEADQAVNLIRAFANKGNNEELPSTSNS